MKKEINELIRWLKKNNKAKLAYLLGYNNTQTIDGWIKTESIPSYQIDRVMKIITSKENQNEHEFSRTGSDV